MGLETATREAIATHQGEALSRLLAEILPRHRFYAAKFGKVAPDVELTRLPFTTKAELLDDQKRSPPYGTLLTYAPEEYTRFNQTSGTHGAPLRWLDTPASWQWM